MATLNLRTLCILAIACCCATLSAADSLQVVKNLHIEKNSTKALMSRMMHGKNAEHIQAETDIDPRLWYEAGRPHLRVRTRTDGVARITGARALGAVPELAGSPLTDIALFYKGIERPLLITDGDADNQFSMADTVWFQGRHPFGDTTWLDRYDTTAVYFLTVRTSGVRRRFDLLPDNAGIPEGDLLPHVRINERYELDTGFYHLGNAVDEVLSTYNTFWATYEGYYWTNLRALAKSRFVQPLTLYPAANGSLSISAHVIAVLDPPLTPDNRADLTVDGAAHVFFEREGIGGEVLTSTQQGSDMPAGEIVMALYSPGVAEHEGKPNYYSDVLLDFITITGDVLPVMHNGMLRFQTPSQSQSMQIGLRGARTNRIAVLDTTNQQFALHTTSARGSLVVASLAPINVRDIISSNPSSAMRAFVRIDGQSFRVDSTVSGLIVVYREPNGVAQMLVDTDPNVIGVLIQSLQTGTVVAVLGNASMYTPIAAALLSAMRNAQLPTPQGLHWVVSGVVRGQPIGDAKASDEHIALGVTSWFVSASGTAWTPTLGLYGGGERTVFVNDMSSVEDARVERAHLSNLVADSSGVDYIYITHATHRAQTDRLAAFRRQHNNVRTRVVDVDDVIDEFGAGQRSPEAIRNYLKHVWTSAPSPKPRYLLLVGNATWDPRIAIPFGNVGSTRPDQVPTFGRPSSDFWFGLLDDENEIVNPDLIVGRIPAITAGESEAQIDKIIQSDTIPFAPWMRRWQFVGGGSEAEGLCDLYTNMISDVFQTGVTFLDAPFCIDTSTLCRYTAPVNAGFYLRKSIDEGVQWMNFVGHGATNTFDINGWDATELANTGRYGVLATYACQTGAYANPSTASENVEYVVVPKRGFMAAMGGTGWEYQVNVSDLHLRIHLLMRSGTRELGALMYAAKRPFAQRGTAEGVNTTMQYSLLGDPLSRVRMDVEPEPYVRKQDVTITDPVGSTQITDDGASMIVTAVVQNAGTGTQEKITVRFRRTYDGTTDSTDVVLDGLCSKEIARCTLDVSGRVGEHVVSIEIDPQQSLGDRRENNTYTQTVSVFARTVLPLYPHAYGVLSAVATKPIRVLDPSTTEQRLVTLVIAPLPDTMLAVRRSAPSEVVRTGSVVDWHVGSLSSDIVGERWLGAWTTNTSGRASAVLWLPITVSDTSAGYGELVQSAGRFKTNDAQSVVIDSITGTIRLRSDTHNIYILSSGIQTSDLDKNPTFAIRIAQTEILRNSYRRGINIVALNATDTVPRVVRRYDTWKDPTPITTGHNGFAEDAIKFLSDSILPSDRLLFASCDESFTAFEEKGLMDTLRVLLKGLGSGFADSLRTSSSWAMIGRKGLAPGQAQESWKGAPDSMVKLNGKLDFYASEGSAYSEWLGPARRLISLTLVDTSLVRNEDASVTIFERDYAGRETAIDRLFVPGEGISFFGAALRAVKAVINLKHTGGPKPPTTAVALRVLYEPADEWIVEPDGLLVVKDSVLRGDTVQSVVRIRNARPEQTSTLADMRVTATGSTVTERVFLLDTTVAPTQADSTANVEVHIPSASLGSTSIVTGSVDPDIIQSESYTFNNVRTQTIHVREDTDTPTIEVRLDDVHVRGGEYVYINPFIEVLVHDNSQLQISDPTKMNVFINGTRIRENTSTDFEFLNTAAVQAYGKYDANDVRAAMRFRFPLELGQNNILVKATDVTGNEADYEVSVFTSSKVEIAEVMPYPNPSSGPFTFSVALADTTPTRSAVLEIYNLQGIRIRALSTSLSVGRGTLYWDGRGDEGQSVATGLYMWKLSATNAGGEPLSHRVGTLTMLR